MKKVNLFIVGTQKGGTTALADFLAKHPNVYVVDGKEAHVFDNPVLQNTSSDCIDIAYQKLLSRYNGEEICCDATPIYMFFKEIPARLFNYNPNARVIIILRDPAERALSHYQMEKKRGDEKLSYFSALLSEKKRLATDVDCYKLGSAHRIFSYRSRGHYFSQLVNIYSHFPKENVLILTNEQLRLQHDSALEKVSHFLKIPNVTIPPAKIFSGNYQVTFKERLICCFLKFYFIFDKIKLRLYYKISL
ncbi:sulfotransferase family protein [Aeromonas hydrophila]|uniref:sulfotransferase family protein n=1 Tax=Aeromonas TaxID=642 RepID=UPI0029671C3F|nr:sulfotransferase [Aeromonas sp. CD]WOX51161.1 sulfotransferase [Aeromonas sp. CD]